MLDKSDLYHVCRPTINVLQSIEMANQINRMMMIDVHVIMVHVDDGVSVSAECSSIGVITAKVMRLNS